MTKEEQDQAAREAYEERMTLEAVGKILDTPEGKRFMYYLFTSLAVTELPAKGLSGEDLHETLGFLRAGHSVFNFVSLIRPQVAAELVARMQKGKREQVLFEDGKG